MFPDSVIAKQFNLSKSKCCYIINFGLGPYFQSELALEIPEKTGFHVLMFDDVIGNPTQLYPDI